MNEYPKTVGRRSLLIGLDDPTTATGVAAVHVGTVKAVKISNAAPKNPVRPYPKMTLDLERTALVVIDPQIDCMSQKSASGTIIGDIVTVHKAIQNLARLFKASKRSGITVAVSLTRDRVRGSGSDFMQGLKRYIEDGKTIICSPYTAYSPLPWVNDIGLQLRKRHLDQIILAGMIANLRIEFHLREFLEQAFEVAVVRDAVTGSKLPEGAGYLSALANFRCIASAIWTTEEAVRMFG